MINRRGLLIQKQILSLWGKLRIDMRNSYRLLAVCFFTGTLAAQMTTEQRVQDFQNLTALYAKRYAPYEWKRLAFGYDLLNAGPWLDRVRRAGNDLEYYEIALEYVANLRDTHSSFRVPSSFAASLGFSVDIYDGKVLVEQIDRMRLPAPDFPFKIGDELISVDGRTSEEWIWEFSRFRKWGSPLTTRRSVADLITFRSQATFPRAVDLGDSATVVVRDVESGTEASYTIQWVKTGVPLTNLGPVPSPKSVTRTERAAAEPDYLEPLREMRNWALPSEDPLFQGQTTSEQGETLPRRYVLGIGGRNPVFRTGLPSNFVQRLGQRPADFHFSGVYEAEGHKIGFLRVPNFGPNPATVIPEIDAEIDYLQKNTDGLVIDVMRNPGGGCYMADLAARLIPHPFFFFGELVRPTLDRINGLQSTIEAAQRSGAGRWIVDLYQFYLDQLKTAYAANRGLTGVIPACNQTMSGIPPSLDQLPASVVYTKPIIILVDEFSISAADIFPSMMQDNQRGLLVGMRTSGGGGSVSGWPVGFFSEAISTNTNSLVVRNHDIVTGDLPSAPYVENIGARPDIELNYMTRDNLLQGGKPFVEAFTGIIVEQIRK